ncbi:MAG: hypothetical protein Q7R35_12715 [Elusimicrobiota bacterium]|nr:hypothetical protein [Elusimicrobiota bacterium]
MSAGPPRARLELAVSFIALGLLALAVSVPLLDLCFWGDDMPLLNAVSRLGFSELLFSPAGSIISQSSYMPLLGVTFRIDWLVFGSNFLGYNIHSLFWLWAAGCSACLLLREAGTERLGAFVGGAAVILAPATVSVSGLYATRHYLFGLAFALLALASLLRWSKGGGRLLFGSALGFCFLAALSKEVYLPLLLIAPLLIRLRRGSFRAPAIGCAAVFALYLGLRFIALPNLVGGYARSYDLALVLTYFLKSLPRLAETLAWGGASPGGVSAAAAAAGGVIALSDGFLAWKKYRWPGVLSFLALVFLSLCVVAPTLWAPSIRYAEDRIYCHGDRLTRVFSTSEWRSFIYLLFAGLKELPQRRRTAVRVAVVAMLPALLFFGGLRKAQAWRFNKITIPQARFMLQNADRKILVIAQPPAGLSSFVKLLRAVRRDAAISAIELGPAAQRARLSGVPKETVSLVAGQEVIGAVFPPWAEASPAAPGDFPLYQAYMLRPGGAIIPAENAARTGEWIDWYNSEKLRLLPHVTRPAGKPGGPEPREP